MEKRNTEVEALYQRFAELFADPNLSNEEKLSLSQEMLKIIYGSNDEVVQ